MDPHKLSTQELVQLCLDSHDEASWTEFVRRFQLPITITVAKNVRHTAFFRRLCFKYPALKPSVLTNHLRNESKLLDSSTFGMDTPWTY